MKVCAYLRKSRADEVREKMEEGYDALSHHRQSLQALADRMGEEVGEWYCDGIRSGDSISGRGEMQRLLAAVNGGEWDAVLCMEVERLTRGDMVDQGTVARAFVDSGTLIVTPQKVYDPQSEADMEYFEFGLFMSRREYKTIKKRMLAGRAAATREGQFIARTAPYGYDKVDVDGKHTLKPNGNARFVVAVYEAFARGDSARSIAKMLDAMGAVPAQGGKWSDASVSNMVRNPAYIGKVRWNCTRQRKYLENGRPRTKTTGGKDPVVADGLHEPIVPMELWDAAQKRIGAAPVRSGYSLKNHYGRILTCAECGKALMYGEGGNCKEPILSHLHRGEGCKTKGCRVRVLDECVVDALTGIAEDIELSLGGSAPDTRRTDYLKSIEQAKGAINANFDRMERGVISEADFVERRKVLEKRISDAEAAIAELPPDSSAQEERVVKLRDAIAMIGRQDVDVDAKRKAIWAIVDRIEYRNRAPIGKDDIELEIWLR